MIKSHKRITWQMINRKLFNRSFLFASISVFLFIAFSNVSLCANDKSDAKLLDEFIRSKGYPSSIVFDESNIKQFWVDNSVSAKDGTINILLNEQKSVPLKLKLINVRESQDCKIEIITENKDLAFSVLDNQLKKISSSSSEEDFLNYHVVSSVFHLEDTSNFLFYIELGANAPTDILKLKKVILSFSHNNDSIFLDSPGEIKITKDNIVLRRSSVQGTDDKDTFSVSGALSVILSRRNIYVSDNTINVSVKIKNIGENNTKAILGFAVYNKNHVWLNFKHYPYNNINKVLTVVSADKGSSKILVDSYPDWIKGGYLVLNAKEDLSDIPNDNLLSSRVSEVNKTENGQAEILLDKPLDQTLEKGMKLRINGIGEGYLATASKVIKPDEEVVLSSTIQKDDEFFQYSPKALSKGVYYIKPLIMSYSEDQKTENTVLISDFIVTY